MKQYKIVLKTDDNIISKLVINGQYKTAIIRRFIQDNKELIQQSLERKKKNCKKEECQLFVTVDEFMVDIYKIYISTSNILKVSCIERLYIPLRFSYDRKPFDAYNLYNENKLVYWDSIETEMNDMDDKYRKYNSLYEKMS
jgi:hypothetical protein